MDMSEVNKVEIWWYAISAMSVINIGLWVCSYRLLWQNNNKYLPDLFKGRVISIWLSLVYVSVCAFRSFLPRIDLERICLVDHWLSSVLVGRTLTTIAEICFIVQCSLLLREAGKNTNNRVVVLLSIILIPVIIIAEVFSWNATLTTNYLSSVIEESLWAASGFLLIAGLVSLWSYADRAKRAFLVSLLLITSGYLVFMVFVDVPMYWHRYLLDTESGKNYLSLWQGLHDISTNYRVSFDQEIWRDEISWMTLYFTVAVWVSLYLPHAVIFSSNKRKV